MSMKNETGINKAGIPTKKKPHLGDILHNYWGRTTVNARQLRMYAKNSPVFGA